VPPAEAAGPAQGAAGYPRWHRIVWAVLAIALSVVIADAAVETFLGDSPLRWWIACAAVLYFGVCVTAWLLMPRIGRHMNWETQAAVALVVLLASLGAAVWLPGGLDQGLSAFRQTTATILDVVSALVVALAGVSLARQPFIPLPVKAVAGLLAIYSVVAFAWAVHSGTPYASLFHGASLWTRLPIWLQGATVGALFLVPVALLLEIAAGLRRITRPERTEIAFKAMALGLGLAITFAAARLPVEDATAAAGATASPLETPNATSNDTPPGPSEGNENPQQNEAAYKQAIEALDRMYAGLDAVDSKIDHSLFETDALADRLGPDPAAMFHFVRDQIRYQPYTGVLRGALGALLCRAGNSLDRSLLLAALLQKQGFKTQIASGQLDSEHAQILVSRLFEPVKPPPGAALSLAELAPEVGRAFGIDQTKLSQLADQLREYGDKQEKDLLNYVNGETSLISNLLSKAGVDTGVITTNDQLLAEASEHYWVQYQDSGGLWVDLDPAFADSEPGRTAASTTNTFAPDSVPEELYHHLQITLTLRVAQVADGNDGTTRDTVLLDKEIRVPDQQGKTITLANSPVPTPDLANWGANFSNSLNSTKGYQPILQVGGEVFPGTYFDIEGRISDHLGGPVGDVVSNAGGVGRGVGGIAGGINGAFGGAPPEGNTSRIVGEWVDYRLTSPKPRGKGTITHSYHRDIISPAIVKSWSSRSADNPQTVPASLGQDDLRRRLLWSAELSAITGAVIPSYPSYLKLESIRASRDAVDSVFRAAYRLPLNKSLNAPPTPPLANVQLSVGITHMAAELTQRDFAGVRTYFDSPGLISSEATATNVPESVGITHGYDIVAFAPRVLADPTSNPLAAKEQARASHILQGVLATRLEWQLLARPGTPLQQTVLNTTEVFKAAEKLKIRTVVLQPGPEGQNQLESLSLPDTVKSELSRDLANGETLVLPVKPCEIDRQLQIAWWKFDSKSGGLIGVMPGGRGQAMTDYTATTAVPMYTVDELVAWGSQAVAVIGEATCLLAWSRSKQGGAEMGGLMACTVGAGITGAMGLVTPAAGIVGTIIGAMMGLVACALWCG
jgi:hypothetical protein